MQDTKMIEEMAITIAKARNYPCCGSCSTCDARGVFCLAYDIAVALVNEGYEKQRVGEWIRHKENCLYNKCSICSYEHCREDNYCPHCGAIMKGE